MLPPTMNIHQCAELFRANQIPIGEDVLARFILSGQLPFAIGVDSQQPGEGRRFLIFRDSAYDWLEKKTKRDVVRI